MAKKIEKPNGLDAFLATINNQPLHPDEFTVKMAHDRAVEKGVPITYNGMRSKLAKDARSGAVVSRPVLLDGKWANAYKYVAT